MTTTLQALENELRAVRDEAERMQGEAAESIAARARVALDYVFTLELEAQPEVSEEAAAEPRRPAARARRDEDAAPLVSGVNLSRFERVRGFTI